MTPTFPLDESRQGWPRWLPLWLAALLSHCTVMPPPPSHPLRMTGSAWTASDAKTLPYHRWPEKDERGAGKGTGGGASPHQRRLPAHPSATKPRAILICVHGLSGAASDFWPLGQELPKRGMLVYALQLRGQGNDPDPAARGDISSAQRWQRDLREFTTLVRHQHPGVPLFWLGESMGSLIVMQTAARLAADKSFELPQGVLLLSPAVGLRDRLPAWKEWLVRGLGHVVPGKRIDVAQLAPDHVPHMQVTRHTTHASQTPLTPHAVKGQSLRLLLEVERMMRRSEEAARALSLPVLVLYTPNDPIVTQEQVERWFEHVAAQDKTRLFFPKDFHLILHDDHRWEAVEGIGDWVLARVAAKRKAASTRESVQ